MYIGHCVIFTRLSRLRNLDEVSLDSPDTEGSTAIYFDLLGLVMVSYPAWTGVLVTVVVVATAVSCLLHDINTISKKQDLQLHVIRSAVLAILLSFLLILVVSIAVNSVTSTVLGLLGATLSWYRRPHLLLLLYVAPTFYCILIIFSKLQRLQLISRLSEEVLELLTFHSANLVLAALASLLTLAGLNSAFIFTNTLVFPLLWRLGANLLRADTSSWGSFLLLNMFISGGL